MDGSTAVVTGASRGIGAAAARRFGEAGAHVVVCARSRDDLEDVVADVEAAGGSATARRADVRDEYEMEQLATAAARAGSGSGIDVLLANAGVYHGSPGETPLAEESYSAVDDHLRTNARGVYAAVRESVPYLGADARVLVSSGRIAREPTAGYGSYAASKAAAEAIARGFAAELDQVVGVVDPGQVATELTGGGAGRDPGEVAELFRWAAAEADPETVDGEVVDLRAWKTATR